MNTSVLIAEDHPIFLQGIVSIINTNKKLKVVATAKDGEEAVNFSEKLKPEIVVMDITMPNLDGIEASKLILAENPKAKILALSIHSGKRFVKGMLNAGAKGYLIKDSAPDELLVAIQKLIDGDMYLSSAITSVALSGEEEQVESTQSEILHTKLYRPKNSSDFIVRQAIIDELESNIHKPLSLVSASAGYGKSVTVSQWLNSSTALHAWISLDEEHNDVRMFLTYFRAAIENVFPGLLNKIGNIVGGGELPAISLISATLINELEELEHPFILVLDDFHRIQNSEVLALVDELVKYPPEHLHLCISTRRDPGLQLNKLRAQNRIAEIRMDNLAFTEEEIITLAQKSRNIDLERKTANALYEKTEGWVVGICLSLLSVNNEYSPEKLLKNMEGTISSTSDFLIEEVLANQEPWIKEMLMFTSLLNRYSPKLIDEILVAFKSNIEKEQTGLGFIQNLFRSNLFVIPLDAGKEWYRYHHLFQELLQNQLKNNYSKEQIKKLHLTASEWYEKHDFIEEAIFHAIEAGEREIGALIIERNREKAVNNDRWYILDKWLDMFPEPYIYSRPGLIMSKSWVLLHHFQFEEVFQRMEQVEKLCEGKTDCDAILGEVALFKGYILFFMGDGETSLHFLKKALKNIPLHYYEARAQTEVIHALSSHMVGKKDYAIEFLDNLFLNPKPTNSVHNSRLLITYVFIHILSCDFHNAFIANDRLQKEIEGNYAYVEAWRHHMEGILNLYQFKLKEALANLKESVDQRYIHFKRAAVDSITAFMLAHQVHGNTKAANEALQTLRDFIVSMHDPGYELLLQTAELRLALLQNNNNIAEQLRKTISLPSAEPAMIWWVEIATISYCRALISEGSKSNLLAANENLVKMQEASENRNNTLHLIEILVLRALVSYKQGNQLMALDVISKALKLAKPSTVILPFVEPGSTLKEILTLVDNEEINSLRNKILYFFENKNIHKEIHSYAHNEQKIENVLVSLKDYRNVLSVREQEILQHVSYGLRNKEVAAKLYISVDTVKKHMSNIFKKLEVKNRIELISKASELELIASD